MATPTLYKIKRDFTVLTVNCDDANYITFVKNATNETIYVQGDKGFKFPENCSVLESDIESCDKYISVVALLENNASLRSLDSETRTEACTDIHKYVCDVPVQHILEHSLVNDATEELFSFITERRCCEASENDFCDLTLEDIARIPLLNMRRVSVFPNIIKSSLQQCLHPSPLKHPGMVSSIPEGWLMKGNTHEGIQVAKPSPLSSPLPPAEIAEITEITEITVPTLSIQDNPVTNTYKKPATESKESKESNKSNKSNKSHTQEETQETPENVIVSFKKLNRLMTNTYNFEESLHSMTLDIIAVYLKGQKLLYIEAKVYCEQHLYALMLPAIVITALCSVISANLSSYVYGGVIVSCMTALNSCSLSLVTYLKLDAKAEAHKMTAYSFEKIQSECEFSSGRILFSDPKITLLAMMDGIGSQVKDIKEKNQFILPESVRHRFPNLYNINVFSEVKRIQNQEIIYMNDMRNLIRIGEGLQDHSELEENVREQKQLFQSLIMYRDEYIKIDTDFRKEINQYINTTNLRWFNCCNWLKT